ncbi:MAG: hypothetical protein ACRDTD_08680 [Pseudonocardiaceae bacterium]
MIATAVAMTGLATVMALADAQPDGKEDPNASERIEDALVEYWQFFRQGDLDKNGFLKRCKFHAHPATGKRTGGKNIRTFVFWMVDDDKDGRVSLQEWFNNELGQFQLADQNHDGVLDAKERVAGHAIEKQLLSDLGYAP